MATLADVDALVALINSAYRGDSSRAGWTTEADLMGGLRTDAGALAAQLARPGSVMLQSLGADGSLVGCVHLERKPGGRCYLGMLTVSPTLQARGAGRALLAEAERFAREEFGASLMEMTVITVRVELLDWYVRRGYRRTGRLLPFPVHPVFGAVREGMLEFEVLEKELS